MIKRLIVALVGALIVLNAGQTCAFIHSPSLGLVQPMQNQLRHATFAKSSSLNKVAVLNLPRVSGRADRLMMSTAGKISKEPLQVVIAGAPASGKGTQCQNIKNTYGLVHLSTGDILRSAVREGTPLGTEAKKYMEAGQLVPDQLIIGVVRERLSQPDCQTCGWLLDGFPRTKGQAEALKASGLNVDCVLLLDVPEEVLVQRVAGRRIDPETNTVYNIFTDSIPEEMKERLVQRSDDKEEIVRKRYEDFSKNILDIESFYKSKIIKVVGTLSPDQVNDVVQGHLDNVVGKKTVRRAGKRGVGLAALTLFYTLLNKVFAQYAIKFPASLAGMMLVFFSMMGLNQVTPSNQMQRIFYNSSYAMSFLKAYMMLLFVPPLVIIPLKLNLLKGMEVKMVTSIALGCFLSLLSTGLVAKALDNNNQKEEEGDNAVMKAAPLPGFPTPRLPLLLSALTLSLSTLSVLPPPLKAFSKLAYQLVSTFTGFLLANNAPHAIKKVFHPVLLTATYTILSLSLFAKVHSTTISKALQGYYGANPLSAGGLISFALQPAILSFGLQLFQYQQLLQRKAFVMVFSTLFASLFGVFSSAWMMKVFGLQGSVGLSLLTRCITTPLALAGAGITGADSSLTALVVVITGILGASFGEKFLKVFQIEDPLSVGLSVGASAHGLGSAAVSYDAKKFSSAVVAMTLTALWTVLLLTVPSVTSLLLKIAG